MDNKTVKENQAAKSKLNPWFIMIIVLLATTAAPLALFKVPTVMGDILKEFSLNVAQGGLVFSIFSLVPIFLAIPAGIIVAKFGSWKLGLIALVSLVAGSLIGLYSHSLSPLLLSRVIEGFAMTMLATIGPNLVTQLFAPEQRGKAMGLFLCYIALGQAVMFAVAPNIVAAFGGWRAVWWFTAIYSLVFILLWAIILKNVDTPVNKAADAPAEKLPFSQVLKNADVWILSLVFISFMISVQGALNFLPTFFAQVKGIESGTATKICGIQGIVGCFSLVISGMISDKLKSRKWMAFVLMLICGGVYASIPFFPASMAIVVVLLIGVFANMVPSVVVTAVTEVVDDPRMIGLSIGFLTTGQFVGLFLSTILFGMFVDGPGWTAAYMFAGAVAAVGGLLMLCVKRISR